MNKNTLSQQEFFIYIPSLHDGDAAADIADKRLDTLPSSPDEWVKISLADQVIVYARMFEEEGQAA